VFYSMLANPHFPAALAAYAGAVACFWRAVWRDARGWTVAAVGCAGCMAVIHPHLVPPLGVLLAAVVLLAAKTKGWAGPGARAGAVLAVAVIPAAAQMWALLSDPVLSVWAAQNRTPSPPLLHVLAGLGAPGLLAAFGVAGRVRGRSGGLRHPGLAVAVLWLAITLALLFAPLGFQRRYYEGLQFPVAALAGTGGAVLLAAGRGPRLLAALLLMLSAPSTLLNAALPVLGTATVSSPVHLSEDDRAAYAWLAANTTPDEVVLAGPVHGNQLPAYAPARVVWGHPFETVNSAAKLNAVRDFYAGRDPGSAAAFLSSQRVTLVYIGDEERALMPAEDPAWVSGEAAFRQGSVTVIRVAPATQEFSQRRK
jgi:hypothetical protein